MKQSLSYGLSLLFVWTFFQLQAQEAPIIRCVSVDSNEDVTVSWTLPSDTGIQFNEYRLYSRTDTSQAFVLQSSITDYSQNSLFIPGSFCGFVEFEMETVANGGTSVSDRSNRVSPMLIGLFQDGMEITLIWNLLNQLSPDSIHRVFKRLPGGMWEKIRNVNYPSNSAKDTLPGCIGEASYKVELKGHGGCTSVSCQPTVIAKDDVPPLQTNLTCASVDTTSGAVNIEWKKSKTLDSKGYLLFYFENFVRSDTVWDVDSLQASYIKDGIDSRLQPETLSVAPFDSCFDSANNWYNQAADSLRLVTLYLDSISYEKCDGELGLGWNMPSEGFPVGVANLTAFRIYRRADFGPSKLMAELTPLDSVYVDRSLEPGVHYTYVVAAYDENLDKEAISNAFELVPPKSLAPEFMHIASIVNDHESGYNVVNLYVDSASEASTFLLNRAVEPMGRWVESTRMDNRGNLELAMVDEEGRADQSAFYYEVIAYDECEVKIGSSQIAKSIYINGYKDEFNYQNYVDWDEYEGYDSAGSTTGRYQLIRETSGTDTFQLVNDYNAFVHVDDVSRTEVLGGDICYYVEVEEDGPNDFGFSNPSVSNRICFQFDPRVFIPTAFSPDGDDLNDVFLPNINYANPEQYSLLIFGREGRIVFQSDDPDIGWDGGIQPIGVYAYQVNLSNARDEEVTFTGKVVLIR